MNVPVLLSFQTEEVCYPSGGSDVNHNLNRDLLWQFYQSSLSSLSFEGAYNRK